MPNLGSKTKYVVHYRNLKYYLSHGLQLTKIHRVISFTQSSWLQPYIKFNTQMRRVAKTTFEKDLFKLLNNAVFVKTMENMRKRVSIELVHTPKRLRNVCAKPNFQSFTTVNEDLVAVNMKKTNVSLNRPIYAECCILDISKMYMYQFHYAVMNCFLRTRIVWRTSCPQMTGTLTCLDTRTCLTPTILIRTTHSIVLKTIIFWGK